MTIHRHAFFVGIAAIVANNGCNGEAASPEPPIGEAASAVAAVCPGTVQVGRVQPGAPCPEPLDESPWVRQRLFQGLAQPLPAVLEPFCLYTWTGQGPPDLGKLPSYQNKGPNEWLDPDCMSVAGMAPFHDAMAAITPELEQSFFAQIEAPAFLPPPPNGGAGVRVAVVDAWPGIGKIGNFEHGFAMAAIARRIACGGVTGACYMMPSPHLALDLMAPDVRNPVNGGFFGYQTRLARAISEAVFAKAALAPQDKLIINLSVGWDGRYNIRPDGQPSEAVLAVRAALEHAACEGALAIAAAGNAGSGPAPGVGPVFPAAWETTPAPSCAGAVPVPPRPLVYAVGGVDGRDMPVPNVRPGGRPTLAAPAFMVPGVMMNGSLNVISGPFTGSSVAAAITSGVAASVWNRNGALRPDEVMGKIRANAVSTLDTADFCLGSTCPPVARISQCRALEDVMGIPLSCTKIPFKGGINPIISPTDRTFIEGLSAATFNGQFLVTPNLPAGCSWPIKIPYGLTSYPGPWPCPSEMLPNAIVMPTVGPQPAPDPCGACTVYVYPASPAILLLNMNSRVPTAFPQTLSLRSRTGTEVRFDLASAEDTTSRVTLGVDGLTGGQVYTVQLPQITERLGTDYHYAMIEWVNTPDAQTTSYLMVEEVR